MHLLHRAENYARRIVNSSSCCQNPWNDQFQWYHRTSYMESRHWEYSYKVCFMRYSIQQTNVYCRISEEGKYGKLLLRFSTLRISSAKREFVLAHRLHENISFNQLRESSNRASVNVNCFVTNVYLFHTTSVWMKSLIHDDVVNSFYFSFAHVGMVFHIILANLFYMPSSLSFVGLFWYSIHLQLAVSIMSSSQLYSEIAAQHETSFHFAKIVYTSCCVLRLLLKIAHKSTST